MRTLLCFVTSLFCSLSLQAQVYVFIGSYSGSKDAEGLYVYQLDTAKGRLTKVCSYKTHNPSYLTLSPDGKYVYACTETKTPGAGSVSSFEFDRKNKKLALINSQSSNGENPVYVATDKAGKWLINANYTEAGVSVYPLENGRIGTMVQQIRYTDNSIDKERQEAAHLHAAVFSTDESHIYFPDLGADKIRCYLFDGAATEPLRPAAIPFISTTLGAGPRHMAFHPYRDHAYCIEELTGTIGVYQYIQGKLKPIQHINTHTDSYKDGFNSADIHISPDGRYLYASNRGEENNIAIYSINANGTLKGLGYQSTLGEHPRMFDIDESGNFLIVANQVSGDVVVFKRNKLTGMLSKVGKPIKVKNASCVKIRLY